MRLRDSQRSPLYRSKNTVVIALAVSLFFLIVGAKWATFDRFGSPMPDWDQWDAEGYHLLIPWLENNRFISHLFLPHNEHRVVLTKIQNFALVLMNGQWDSRLEAVTNALLHAALGVAFWIFARRWTAPRWHAPVFLLVAALFGLPLAWQNVLGGFHSQQYWLLGLSFATLVTLPLARPWTASWWVGASAATLALGSMGSGFLAAAVVLVVLGWRVWRKETTARALWPTIVLCLGFVAIGLLTRIEVDYHQQLKAKTAHDFVFSALRSLEWPLRDQDWAGAILWLPWLLVLGHVLRPSPKGTTRAGDPSRTPSTAFSLLNDRAAPTIAALGGWVVVQILATAFARGAGADYPASRYMDTLTFGTTLNGIALAWLLSWRPSTQSRWKRVGPVVLGLAWLALVGWGLRDTLERNLRHELPDAKKYYIKAEGYLRGFLVTKDPAQLAYPDIPYPSAEGLITCLAHPDLGKLMPVPLRPPLPLVPDRPSRFVEYDRISTDRERGTSNGLPPETPPPSGFKYWSSFGVAPAPSSEPNVWRSAPVTPPPFGWLKFKTAGDLGHSRTPVSLTLQDAETGRTLARIAPSDIPANFWHASYVRTPKGPFVIVAADASPAHWLAFVPPVAMGSGSYWAWRATRNGLLIMYLAAGASLILAIIAARRNA